MSHAVRTSNAKSLAEALVVWFFWTGATAVGLGIANAISFWLFFIAFFALQTDIGVLGYAIVATIGALVGGSLLALCYLLVLRLPQEKWLGWFLWMCLAWLLTAAVVVLVFATSLFRDTQIYVLNPALLAVVGGVWVGTVFAICQWRTLRHLYAGMGWWILASILGWILYFQFINYLAKLPLMDSFWKFILAGGDDRWDGHRRCPGWF